MVLLLDGRTKYVTQHVPVYMDKCLKQIKLNQVVYVQEVATPFV